MTNAGDIIKPGRWLLRANGSHTYHKFNGCWYATTREDYMQPVQAAASIIRFIEQTESGSKLCIKCFGTDGKSNVTPNTPERSRKVTVDADPAQAQTELAITPDDPGKDHEMAPTATLPKGKASDASAQQPAAPPDAPDASGWSWDALPESIAHTPYKTPPPASWDAIAGTPEVVRRKAEVSLGHNAAATAKAAQSTAKNARPQYRWDLQPVPDEDTGAKFAEIIEKYAAHRPASGDIPYRQEGTPGGRVTARCGKPTQFIKDNQGYIEYKEGMTQEPFWVVRYSVRPFEQRGAGRKPNATA